MQRKDTAGMMKNKKREKKRVSALHKNGRPVACHQFQRIECHCDWLGLTQRVTLETQTSNAKKRYRDALERFRDPFLFAYSVLIAQMCQDDEP